MIYLPMRKDDQAANNKRKRTQKAVLALPADLEGNIAQCDRQRNYLGEVRFARLTQELRYWSVLDKDTASEKRRYFFPRSAFEVFPNTKIHLCPRNLVTLRARTIKKCFWQPFPLPWLSANTQWLCDLQRSKKSDFFRWQMKIFHCLT